MRGRGPEPRQSPERRRAAMLIGLLLGLLIVAVLVWVFGTWPRPGWQGSPPPIPVSPAQDP
jgi:hypothetical protein